MSSRTESTLFGQDLFRDVGKAISSAAELKNQKGNRSWRQTIKAQGLHVYGTPMPGHQPRAYTDTEEMPIVMVVDNSLPESTQDIAMVEQYLHLKLGYSNKAEDFCKTMAVTIGTMHATQPTDEHESSEYFRENPEMEDARKSFVTIAAVIIGFAIAAIAIKGVSGWLKR